MCHRSFIRFTGSNSGVLADSWMRSGLNGSLEQNELLFWGLKLRRLVMNDLVSIWSILVSIYYASIYCFPVILRLLRIISCYNVYIYILCTYIIIYIYYTNNHCVIQVFERYGALTWLKLYRLREFNRWGQFHQTEEPLTTPISSLDVSPRVRAIFRLPASCTCDIDTFRSCRDLGSQMFIHSKCRSKFL